MSECLGCWLGAPLLARITLAWMPPGWRAAACVHYRGFGHVEPPLRVVWLFPADSPGRKEE